ncbi:MAG TPA: hypothetical protein ENK41_03905, partial [Rhodobacteraceae bacterium]|nr:hypothetical protein [Paracoccaceae bacterium]
MPAPRRILVLVMILALGLLALKMLAATSGIAALIDPATPAWAASAKPAHDTGKAHKKAEKNGDHKPEADAPEAEAVADAAAPPPPQCSQGGAAEQAGLSEAELNVYMKLAERSKLLDKRESEIATKEGLLEVSQKKLDQRIATLQALKDEIQSLLGQLDEQEEQQMQALTKLYNSMKPKAAAKIFTNLDEAVLLQVASRMKADTLAKVMAAMPPQK